MVPITTSRLKELGSKVMNMISSEPPLKQIGRLSFSSGFSGFSMKLLGTDGDCLYTLKSGKRQPNFDRAIEEQVEVYRGNTNEKLVTVRQDK